MKRNGQREKTVKKLILRDDELLQLTTAVEGPLGYKNSLIINGTNKKIVLVPQYGAVEDSTAIEIYEQVMPDYEIIGIYSNLVIDYWGAIHCTTMTRPLVN